MIYAFGPESAALSARLGDPFDAVLSDISHLQEASVQTRERRARGEQLYGMLLWVEPRIAVTWFIASKLLAAPSSLDHRNSSINSLQRLDYLQNVLVNGQPASLLLALPSEEVRKFAEMTAVQLFRSRCEVKRFRENFNTPFREWELLVVPAELPDVSWRPTREPLVVIWAPYLSAPETSFLAFALEELHAETWVVCSDGDAPDVRANYIHRDDPRVRDLLGRASCIVDSSLSDPAAAIAFAERGFPVVSSWTTGAAEFVSPVGLFIPWAHRTVYWGVLQSLGRPASARHAFPVMPPRLTNAAMSR
ncbi:MAG TPA: hypothetical protein VGG22_15990 [Candidatus Baltobacteraceae bacterium]|jgi:hypothetical protein